jgi:GNAT superfamily N-acetyltransferase
MEVRVAGYEEARPLVEALAVELHERYGGGPASVAHSDDFAPPYGVFFVVSQDGRDVGGGGIRRLDGGIGEVKRMYVVPDARRQGISRLLLKALVERATELGYGELWLETGTAQPEAMALYESAGFERIPPYGQYKEYDNARCYRRVLPD